MAIQVAAEHHAATMWLSGRFVLNQTAVFTQRHGALVVDQWPEKPAALISGGVDLPASAWSRDPKADPHVEP